MDRFIYVLSVDNGSRQYDGKVWCESIDSIISLNGVLVNGRSWKGRVVSSCRRRRRNSEPLLIPDTLKRVKIEGNEVSQGSGGDPPGKPAKLAVNVQHIMKDTQRCISKVRMYVRTYVGEYAYIRMYIQFYIN